MNREAIILFAFNRPEHFIKVLQGLKENNVDEIYVYVDGPRNSIEFEVVKRVRKQVKNIDWCKVNYKFQEKNMGLATSVIKGITEVFDKGYERVIVIEEDCVPKNNFIKYMKETFDFYENYEEIMHISGFGLPINKRDEYDTYITPYPCSWGWGTWKKYWDKCEFNDINGYNNLLKNKDEMKRFNEAGEGFTEFLEKQFTGKVDSWLIRWYYHIFKNKGKCLWVYDSLIYNIGFDGTGKHKVRYDRFNQNTSIEKKNKKFKYQSHMEYNNKLLKEFRRYFMGSKKTEKIKTILYTIYCKIFR